MKRFEIRTTTMRADDRRAPRPEHEPQRSTGAMTVRRSSAALAVVAAIAFAGFLFAGCQPSGSVLRGTLTASGGTSAQGIPVVVYSNTSDSVVAQTTTDHNGHYAFPPATLGDGTYRVLFSSTDWWQDAADWASATPVAVSVADPVTIDETLAPAVGSVAGTVTDENGPVGGASVSAINATTDRSVASTTTALDGTYSFAQLPAAEYVFRFASSGRATRYNGSASTASAAPVVEVATDAHVTGVDAVLSAEATITGHVTSGATPLGGIVVVAYGESSGQATEAVTTAADGTFTIDRLQAGGYTIAAISPGNVYAPQVVGTSGTDPTQGTVFSPTVGGTVDVGTIDVGPPRAVPGAPREVIAAAGNGQAVVSWSAPADDGGLPITGYTVTASSGQSCATTGDTTCTVTGLTNGTSSTFTVTATNAFGTSSPSSASASVTPGVAPDAPLFVDATLQGSAATVNWTAPFDGGSPITGYTATASTGQSCSTTGATSCTVTGLAWGTSVTFTATATNALGTSGPSATSGPRTPSTVPGTPTGLTATVTSPGYVTLSWTAPVFDGFSPIQYYEVHVNVTPGVGPGTMSLAVGTSKAITFAGGPLPTDTPIEADITAYNANGVGVATAPLSFYASDAPGAPLGVNAIAGDGQATVYWDPPVSDGGSTITGYTVTASSGQSCVTTGDTMCTVTGLTNDALVTFTVTATNGPGTGPASDASPPVLVGVPAAPTGVTAVPGTGQATVSWEAPAPNGGPPVTDYAVTASTGQRCFTSGALTCTVTGLTPGMSVTFTVTATNDAGTSSPSIPSVAVVLVRAPDAPTAVTARVESLQVTVLWNPPYADGGSPVTGYTVTASTGQTCSTTGALTCTVTGLASGIAVTFTVTATNDAGTSIPSVPSNTVTP